jgi:hypothetical protein
MDEYDVTQGVYACGGLIFFLAREMVRPGDDASTSSGGAY